MCSFVSLLSCPSTLPTCTHGPHPPNSLHPSLRSLTQKRFSRNPLPVVRYFPYSILRMFFLKLHESLRYKYKKYAGKSIRQQFKRILCSLSQKTGVPESQEEQVTLQTWAIHRKRAFLTLGEESEA